MDAESLFSGIEEAKERFGSDYERPGHYIERIDRCKIDKTRGGDGFFVIEKTIIHVIDDCEGTGHRAGQEVSHMMMRKHDSFLGNVKAFLANTLSFPADQVDLEACKAVCARDQPLAGLIIECKNHNIQTRQNNPFTVINYRGEVPASRLKKLLTDQEVLLFFPDGKLDQMLEQEQAAEQSAS